MITECLVIRIIAREIHTNWLMTMGARECSLKIHDNSIHLRLEVMGVSNFGVHHSSRVKSMCLWLCTSLLKCLENGVSCPSFWTVALCSYILFLSGLLVSLTYYLWHLEKVIRHMRLLSSHVSCFGKLIGLYGFLVKLHMMKNQLILTYTYTIPLPTTPHAKLRGNMESS